jgi:hypothetical protein
MIPIIGQSGGSEGKMFPRIGAHKEIGPIKNVYTIRVRDIDGNRLIVYKNIVTMGTACQTLAAFDFTPTPPQVIGIVWRPFLGNPKNSPLTTGQDYAPALDSFVRELGENGPTVSPVKGISAGTR